MGIIGDILAEVKTRIESVTTDNGYSYAINSVTVPTKPGTDMLHHLDAVVRVSGDPAPLPDLSSPGNPPRIAFELRVLVAAVISPDDNDPTPFDELAFQVGADMQTAITRVEDWYRFGGNTINASLTGLTAYRPGDDSPHGIAFEIVMIYRVSETNLNELRG